MICMFLSTFGFLPPFFVPFLGFLGLGLLSYKDTISSLYTSSYMSLIGIIYSFTSTLAYLTTIYYLMAYYSLA